MMSIFGKAVVVTLPQASQGRGPKARKNLPSMLFDLSPIAREPIGGV